MRLIDADALKDRIKIDDKPAFTALAEGLKSWIDRQPTIDPVKHGKWVSDGFTWRCSECGKTYWGRLAQPWNYCPNCGTRVEEKK